MAQFRKLQGKIFNIIYIYIYIYMIYEKWYIFGTVRSRIQICNTSFIDFNFAIEWRHCESSAPWLWSTFLKSKRLQMSIMRFVFCLDWVLCGIPFIYGIYFLLLGCITDYSCIFFVPHSSRIVCCLPDTRHGGCTIRYWNCVRETLEE